MKEKEEKFPGVLGVNFPVESLLAVSPAHQSKKASLSIYFQINRVDR